jgi:SAM-dependent methyltransferase
MRDVRKSIAHPQRLYTRPPLEVNLEERLALAEQAPRYLAWTVGRCEPYLGTRVLDFGAGTGNLTRLLAREGREIVAFEPFAEHAGILRERLGDEVSVTETLDRDGFDSVVCVNVLEHIEDDRGALADIHRTLRPGGFLLALVPAHPVLYGANDRLSGHERRYTKSELGGKLEHAGFEIRELRHVNPVGALGWLMSGKVLRRGEITGGSLRLYDRAVPVLQQLDRLRLPVGLSLWTIARK